MKMRNLAIVLIVLSSGVTYSQIRAFDNSKAIMPWIYNPASDFTKAFQAYVGYDGRGNSSFTPQAIIAGVRMPVDQGRRKSRNRMASSMIGVQMLNVSQDMLKTSTINASFAHQIMISKKVRLGMGLGAGIFNMEYDNDDLVYFDQNDPLLANGDSFFNVHLNAGFSLMIEDMLVVNLASPYLIKDYRANVKEIIFRVSHILPLAADVKMITSVNLDTYNNNLIYGGDVRMEWRSMVSIMAGADRYKYHGGMLLNIKPFSLGYSYGQNYLNTFGYVPSHQISVFSHIPSSPAAWR
jgi:hypothetical protein